MSWRYWTIAIYNARTSPHEEKLACEWSTALAQGKALADEFKRGGDDGTWRIELINDLNEISRSWGKLPPDTRGRISNLAS